MAEGEQAIALEWMEWMLALNISDNHGWRTLVVNARLREGWYQGALDVCEHYPEDSLPEVLYGGALALFALGRHAEADIALAPP